MFATLESDDAISGGDGDDSVVLPGHADGYIFVALANGKVGIVDIDPDGDQGSGINPTNLNDPYYAPFNAENTYLNFAIMYATGNADTWFGLIKRGR